jgi:hypothetical protein
VRHLPRFRRPAPAPELPPTSLTLNIRSWNPPGILESVGIEVQCPGLIDWTKPEGSYCGNLQLPFSPIARFRRRRSGWVAVRSLTVAARTVRSLTVAARIRGVATLGFNSR